MIIEETSVSVISWFLKWSSCDIWPWCDNVGMQVWSLALERPKQAQGRFFIELSVKSIPFLYDQSDQDMHFPSSQIWGQS